MRFVHLTIGFLLSIQSLVVGQDQWIATGCTNSPTLDRIGINGCTGYDPDEFIIFHTNHHSFDLHSETLEIKVDVQNGPFIADYWSQNQSALDALNNSAKCERPLFLDPFSPPYNGIIPPQAKVWAFVQWNPSFTGNTSGLCNEEAVFVIFGNFSHGVIGSMFANTCSSQSNCERNITVTFGTCRYDIVYSPDNFNDKKGDFIESSGTGVTYGTSPGCIPVFHSLPSPQDPMFNIDEIKICENEINDQSIIVNNGDSFTSWHFSPTEEPFHRGMNYTPEDFDFPETNSDGSVSRSIWVYNYVGGRRSKGAEIILTTLKNPFAEIIIPNYDCSDVYFQPELSGGSHTNGFWSIYPSANIDSENGRIPIENLKAENEYQVQFTTEKEGCTYTAKENLFAKDCSCSISMTLTNKICNNNNTPANPADDTYTVELLVHAENSASQNWHFSDNTTTGSYGIAELLGPFPIADGEKNFTIVDQADPGCYSQLTVNPPEPCSEPCMIEAEIISISTCEEEQYFANITITGNGQQWKTEDNSWFGNHHQEYTIGPFHMNDGEQTLTIIDLENTQCKTNLIFSPPEPCSEPCTIKAEIISISPCEEDQYFANITISGNGQQWKTEDNSWFGNHHQEYTIGPFHMNDGEQTLTIIDLENTQCKTNLIFSPPEPCSEPCTIKAEIISISPCEEEQYFANITISGNGQQWKTEDDTWFGNHHQEYTIGPFHMNDGEQTLTIIDLENTQCKTNLIFSPPEPCSEPCTIKAEIISISPCEEEQYFANITISGNGQQWKTEDNSWFGNHHQEYTIGPFHINDGEQTLTIIDLENTQCKTDLLFSPPEPCSEPCMIEAEIISISPCEEDQYFANITISGNGQQWKTEDNSWFGNHHQEYTIGPFHMNDGEQTLTIINLENTQCKTDLLFSPPEPCSEPCMIKAEIISISTCEEEQYFANIIITGNGQQWKTEDDTWFGNHHQEYTIGPFHINDGEQTLTIIDLENTQCKTDLIFSPPEPCSEPCMIEAEIISISTCEEEQYFANITITGNGQQWKTEDNSWFGNHHQEYTIGPFHMNDGEQTLTIIDLENTQCKTDLLFSPPEPCSDPCTIEAEIISISPCEENQYFANINISGNGQQWKTDDNSWYGNHHQEYTIGPFHINDGEQIITIIDLENTQCKTDLIFSPPEPCSEPCLIEAEIISISPCKEEQYFANITITGNGQQWKTEDNLWFGNHHQEYTIGPFHINDGEQTLTIIDLENTQCKTDLLFSPPEPCSEPCMIEAEIISISTCEEEQYFANITITGNGQQWKTEDDTWFGNHHQEYTIGPFHMNDGDQTLTIIDLENTQCKTELIFSPPEPCSDSCMIEAEIISISPCEEDQYFANINISGNGQQWKTEDDTWFGNHHQEYTIGPFHINDGEQTLTIIDLENTQCKTELIFSPPEPCSDPCLIEAEIISISTCEEDQYFANINISGNGQQWKTEDNSWFGNHHQEYTIGPFHINDGDQIITIIDLENTQCKTELIFSPPEPCPKKCDINLTFSDSVTYSDENIPQLWIRVESYDADTSGYYFIYFDSKLIDILHHQDLLYLGPFSREDIGKELNYVFSKNSLCSLRRTIPNFDCQNKISINAIPISTSNLPRQQNTIRIQLQASNYPFELYHQDKFIDSIHRAGVFEINILDLNNSDSVYFTATAEGCSSSFSIPKPIFQETKYPNAFSPNHDGINDEFVLPRIDCEGSLTIRIYDKWGNILDSREHSCTDPTYSIWDGKIGEKDADPGLYIYMIHYHSDGKFDFRAGEIHLLR